MIRSKWPLQSWGALVLAAATVGCGTEAPTEPTPSDPDPTGIWRALEAGVRDTYLSLDENGTFQRVVADLAGSSCLSSSGSWTEANGSLSLMLTREDNDPVSRNESFTLTVEGASLTLTGTSGTTAYSTTSSMVSCVDFGFGAWEGTVEAEVDGVPTTFTDLTVHVDIDAGELEIEASMATCSGCASEPTRLVLRVATGSGPLSGDSYTVQNVPGATNTLYGLYHPEPASTSFSGFDTTRLSPPGSLTLSTAAPEEVVGSFAFRGNPRVDGETGPGGETFVEIDSGQIDLVYR